MCVLTALRLHDGNDRDEFFLCLLRIKFWVLILFLNLLDKAAIVSYNTTPAEEGTRSGSPLCAADFSDHIVIISFLTVDHIWWLVCFFSVLYTFLLCQRNNFWALLPPQNHDHISIIRYSDLTTYLTTYRTGAHGDKNARERVLTTFVYQKGLNGAKMSRKW